MAEEQSPCVQAFLEKHSLRDYAAADHICYKCSLGKYEFFRELLEAKNVGIYSFQEWISGRRIAYVKLHKPLIVGTYGFKFVELSEYSPLKKYDEFGFHHVEIYPVAPTRDYEHLCEILRRGGETLVLKERPHHTTHDITLQNGFVVRLTREALIKKISREIS